MGDLVLSVLSFSISRELLGLTHCLCWVSASMMRYMEIAYLLPHLDVRQVVNCFYKMPVAEVIQMLLNPGALDIMYNSS